MRRGRSAGAQRRDLGGRCLSFEFLQQELELALIPLHLQTDRVDVSPQQHAHTGMSAFRTVASSDVISPVLSLDSLMRARRAALVRHCASCLPLTELFTSRSLHAQALYRKPNRTEL